MCTLYADYLKNAQEQDLVHFKHLIIRENFDIQLQAQIISMKFRCSAKHSFQFSFYLVLPAETYLRGSLVEEGKQANSEKGTGLEVHKHSQLLAKDLNKNIYGSDLDQVGVVTLHKFAKESCNYRLLKNTGLSEFFQSY